MFGYQIASIMMDILMHLLTPSSRARPVVLLLYEYAGGSKAINSTSEDK